ncbi:glycosyltransferase [Gammaproteobacteria bacterium]|nr:glycosyltransferase [Gammaproteobacteria bacterium]
MVKNISLIIPSLNAEKKLVHLLTKLLDWEVIPNEIIIVDSSQRKFLIPKILDSSIKKLNISLIIIYGDNLYPGHARNIGIANSTNSLLAFLDTSTHPNTKWLSSGLYLMNKNNSQGVWGNTYYEAKTYTSKIIRACTFGNKPIKTFPGSILKKDIFIKCGLFIESTRAGEDGDWMSRLNVHKITICHPDEYLNYDDLNNMSIIQLLKKWFRNYTFSGKLPHRRLQKDYYFYFISIVAVLVAYNWNTVIASWDTESIYFIPNITKISLFLMIIIYLFIRGIMLPRKKGINYSFIFPINFLIISMVSACIDFTKALAFGYSKFKK